MGMLALFGHSKLFQIVEVTQHPKCPLQFGIGNRREDEGDWACALMKAFSITDIYTLSG